jgi:hypothetical protein
MVFYFCQELDVNEMEDVAKGVWIGFDMSWTIPTVGLHLDISKIVD